MIAKSWSTFSKKAQPIVNAAVQIERRDGAKQMDAMATAAKWLGLSDRQVRSLIYAEPVRITRDKYEALLSRWCSYQERQAEELEEKAAKLRRRAEQDRVRDRQPELELEPAWEGQSLISAVYGSPTSRSGSGGSRRSTV